MTTSPALFGTTAGLSTAVLAIAAHGAAGGDVPSNPAVALLIGVAVGVGLLGAQLPSLSPLVLLTGGQFGTHVVLSAMADDHAHLTPGMIAAHIAAVLGCAVLLGVADRLHAACTRAVRRVLVRFRSFVDAPRSVAARVDPDGFVGATSYRIVSPRGPPVTAVL